MFLRLLIKRRRVNRIRLTKRETGSGTGTGDVRLGDVRLGDVRLGDVGRGNIGRGDVGRGDVGRGDVGRGDVGRGTRRLGEVKTRGREDLGT